MSRSMSAADQAKSAPTQLRVRPYLLTGGRTSSDVELKLESLIETTEAGAAALSELNLESESIVKLCQEAIPLTELAARLELPLQVARVLTGDLITEGLLNVRTATEFASERPDLDLLERVLDGLQSL